MNPEIRAAVIEAFKASPGYSEEVLVNIVQSTTRANIHDVFRTVSFMKDNGELTGYGVASLRLTLKGATPEPSRKDKTMIYLAAHWEAIVALIISLIALLKP